MYDILQILQHTCCNYETSSSEYLMLINFLLSKKMIEERRLLANFCQGTVYRCYLHVWKSLRHQIRKLSPKSTGQGFPLKFKTATFASIERHENKFLIVSLTRTGTDMTYSYIIHPKLKWTFTDWYTEKRLRTMLISSLMFFRTIFRVLLMEILTFPTRFCRI